LRLDVRTALAGAASLEVRRFESFESRHDSGQVGVAASVPALVDKLGECSMTALAIAPRARAKFVLEPRRPAFDAGHKMLASRVGGRCVDIAPAPHAGASIASHNRLEAGALVAAMRLPGFLEFLEFIVIANRLTLRVASHSNSPAGYLPACQQYA
jgi:hypothetical protein